MSDCGGPATTSRARTPSRAARHHDHDNCQVYLFRYFPLTGSAHHRSRSEGTLRRFLSPMTHRHHDATVRQHQAHDPHQSLTG